MPGHGAEDVVVGRDGWVYTGTEDGCGLPGPPRRPPVDRVGHTGGRPLGLELLPDGRLLVCDATRLLALDPPRADRGAGHWCAASRAGLQQRGRAQLRRHLLLRLLARLRHRPVEGRHVGEHRLRPAAAPRRGRRGRGGRRAACASRTASRCAADESFVAVAETGGRTVVRHWLTGPQDGRRRTCSSTTSRLSRQHRARQRRPDLGHVPRPRRRARADHDRARAAAPAGLAAAGAVQPKPKRTVRVMAFDDRAAPSTTAARRDRLPLRDRRARARRPGLARQPRGAGGRGLRPVTRLGVRVARVHSGLSHMRVEVPA